MFYGEYKHTIDAKGRLFIPAKLREKLGEEFIVARVFDKCICVYPSDEWERFTEKLESLPIARDRRVRRYYYANASEASVDAQGRVTISQANREYASLSKEVVIVGSRSHLEIWSESAWNEEISGIDSDSITAELEELGF